MPGFDDWDDNGHLKVWPLLGFATAVFPDRRGGLRLEVGTPPKPGAPAAAMQVAPTEEQLRTLSDALADTADRMAAAKGSAPDA